MNCVFVQNLSVSSQEGAPFCMTETEKHYVCWRFWLRYFVVTLGETVSLRECGRCRAHWPSSRWYVGECGEVVECTNRRIRRTRGQTCSSGTSSTVNTTRTRASVCVLEGMARPEDRFLELGYIHFKRVSWSAFCPTPSGGRNRIPVLTSGSFLVDVDNESSVLKPFITNPAD
jgi:hypothetical protein